jgi:hypothetical protein
MPHAAATAAITAVMFRASITAEIIDRQDVNRELDPLGFAQK